METADVLPLSDSSDPALVLAEAERIYRDDRSEVDERGAAIATVRRLLQGGRVHASQVMPGLLNTIEIEDRATP